MMHVVHVIDPEQAGDQALLACAACLDAGLCSQSVILIGSASGERAAWALGVRSVDRVWSRSRSTGPTARALARVLRERQGQHDDPIVVNCWSVTSAALCAQARPPTHWPTVFMSTGSATQLLAAGLPDGFVRVQIARDDPGATPASLSGIVADSIVSHARPIVSHARPIVATPVRQLGPFVPRVDRLTSSQRARARAALDISPSDRVVMLLADPPARGDLQRFSMVLGLLQAAGSSCVGIARAGGSAPERAVRFAHGLGNRWALLQLEGSIVDLLSVSDVAVIDHPPSGVPSCGSVGIQLAASLGVPVVMPASDDPSGDWGEGGQLLAAAGQEAIHLMPKVLALVEDPSLCARVANQVRSHLLKHEGEGSFAQRVFWLWQEVANVECEIVGSSRA